MRIAIRAAFVLFLLSLAQQAPRAQFIPPEVEGTSRIAGKIFDVEGRKVRGARVLAYHLSSARLFESEPTSADGEYRISGVPYGYHDLAVKTADGLFVANRIVNVAPAGTAAVIFTLVPYGPGGAASIRKHPGSDLEPSGRAEVRRKPKGREFWRSAKGVAIIGAAAGAALVAIVAGSDSEPQATVFR